MNASVKKGIVVGAGVVGIVGLLAGTQYFIGENNNGANSTETDGTVTQTERATITEYAPNEGKATLSEGVKGLIPSAGTITYSAVASVDSNAYTQEMASFTLPLPATEVRKSLTFLATGKGFTEVEGQDEDSTMLAFNNSDKRLRYTFQEQEDSLTFIDVVLISPSAPKDK